MYYLWPVSFQDGQCGTPAMLPRSELLHFMQVMESAGVPTRHPHPSHLYDLLLSKKWYTLPQFFSIRCNSAACTSTHSASLLSEAPRALTPHLNPHAHPRPYLYLYSRTAHVSLIPGLDVPATTKVLGM